MKNFTKTAIAAIAVLLLALGTAACTNQTPQPEPEPSPPAEQPSPEPAPITAEQPTPEPEPVPVAEQHSRGPFPFPFTAEELNGSTITEASLGERELFFIYYWTTWCPACVNSMPGLVEMAEEFADYVGFITLLGDFGTARETAIRITGSAPFYTMNSRDGDFEYLMQLVQPRVVPTSIIIDTEGNIVGERIEGGGTARFRTAIENALEQVRP